MTFWDGRQNLLDTQISEQNRTLLYLFFLSESFPVLNRDFSLSLSFPDGVNSSLSFSTIFCLNFDFSVDFFSDGMLVVALDVSGVAIGLDDLWKEEINKTLTKIS